MPKRDDDSLSYTPPPSSVEMLLGMVQAELGHARTDINKINAKLDKRDDGCAATKAACATKFADHDRRISEGETRAKARLTGWDRARFVLICVSYAVFAAVAIYYLWADGDASALKELFKRLPPVP